MDFAKLAFRSFTVILLLAFSVTPTTAVDDSYTEYRSDQQTWIVGNAQIQAAFQLDGMGRFRYRWLYDPVNRRLWRGSDASPSSPVSLTIDGAALDAGTAYNLISYSFEDISSPASGVRFSIVLSTDTAAGQIQFEADVYNGQPFVRYRTQYKNTGSTRSFITDANMLSWAFQDGKETYRDFFVNQWKFARAADFEPHETNISGLNGPVKMYAGAYADHVAWRAIRDSHNAGFVAAWEFNGR